LPTAYAQITHISLNAEGIANAIFVVQQNRDMISTSQPVETKHIRCLIDKEQPIYAQVYIQAKTELFEGWEDDIVVPEQTN
jgi:hypothetical protein